MFNTEILENESQCVTLSPNALARIQFLIESEGKPELNFRIYILGGGCSGFQYGFSFDKEQREDDYVIKQGSVSMVVDSLSAQYLTGAIVDYVENLEGARFLVQNPNADTTCGCGSSFSLKE